MKIKAEMLLFLILLLQYPAVSRAESLEGCVFLSESLDAIYAKKVWEVSMESVRKYQMTTAISVVQNGKVLYDWRDAEGEEAIDLMSVTKSVVALGIAAAELDGTTRWLNERLSDVIPGVSESGKKDITLRHVLEQTTCLGVRDVADATRAFDQTAFAFGADLVCRPGERFSYNNGASNLALAFLGKKLGTNPADAIRKYLFEPLGIDPGPWYADGRGVPQTMAGLHLTHNDLRKIARMVLDDGFFEGRRVISAAWMRALFTPSKKNAGYGLMWWLGLPQGTVPGHESIAGRVIWAQGAGGQLVFLFPEEKVAVVHQRNVKETEAAGVGREVMLALMRASVESVAKTLAQPSSQR